MAKSATNTQLIQPLLMNLKVSEIKRGPSAINDPVTRARSKLVEGIKEQIQYAEAERKGEHYVATRTVYVTDTDGKRVKKEAPKRKSVWFWKTGNTFHTQVKYGAAAINFGNGTAVECGPDLDSVIAMLTLISHATGAGELDAQLGAQAAKRVGRKPRVGASKGSDAQRAA